MGKKDRFCKDCVSCIGLFDYEDDSELLFCSSALTKQGESPVGFLQVDSMQCEHFEDARAEPGDYTATPRRGWFLLTMNK